MGCFYRTSFGASMVFLARNQGAFGHELLFYALWKWGFHRLCTLLIAVGKFTAPLFRDGQHYHGFVIVTSRYSSFTLSPLSYTLPRIGGWSLYYFSHKSVPSVEEFDKQRRLC